MNLLERVLTLLRANLNTVVEKADDPEKVLQQLQLDMRNQLVQVKTQVATAIAEKHKLQKRSDERKAEASTWLKKAEHAVQQGNDESARSALARYNEIQRQMQRYQQQREEQEKLVATLRSALQRLEDKIAEVETTIDILATRKRNALLQQRVYEALNKTSGTGTKGQEQAARARDAIMEAEARARALSQIQQHDLTTQLEQISAEQTIEQQLREMKQKYQDGTQRPLLQEGNHHPSPLLHPQPQAGTPVRKRERPDKNTKSTPSVPATSMQHEIDLEQLKKLLEQPESTTPQE